MRIDLMMKEAYKAGVTEAVISLVLLVLKVGPEIFKTIDYLIKNGEIEESQFKKIGFTSDTFELESFSFDTFEPDNLEITFLRRGVIGVSKIGYI